MKLFNDPNLSAGELQALQELVPFSRPAFPRLSGLLQPLREALAPKWVRDFLFTPSPIHIPLLLAPALPMTSLTCRATSTSVDRNLMIPVRRSGKDDYYHSNGYILFTSAFNANETTVGVGIWYAASKGSPVGQKVPKLNRYNLRFARDAKTRTLVIILDCADDNVYHITTARIETSTRFRVMHGYFTRDLQDIALREERELLLQHISSSVIMAQDEVQWRTCTLCGAPPEGRCSCELPSETPAHPYDSDYFLRGMSLHIGTSHHFANRMSFTEGKGHNQEVLGCRVTFDGILNAEVIRMMSTWSLSEHAKTVHHDPLQSALFSRNDHDSLYPQGWENTRRLLLDISDDSAQTVESEQAHDSGDRESEEENYHVLDQMQLGDVGDSTIPSHPSLYASPSQKSTIASLESPNNSFDTPGHFQLSNDDIDTFLIAANVNSQDSENYVKPSMQAVEGVQDNPKQFESRWCYPNPPTSNVSNEFIDHGCTNDENSYMYKEQGSGDVEMMSTMHGKLEAWHDDREIELRALESDLRHENPNLRRVLAGEAYHM